MNKNADEYLDTINTAFAIQETENKFRKALDDTKSIKNQQALKKLMNEQLDILKNKQKVTQYDIDRAEKLLEVERARIALEEAQSAKTSLRLKRDSQGNYKYVYAADQDDIRGKQRELLESEFDAYEMSKDANGDAYQQGIALYQQYIEQRTAIEKKYANDVDTMEKELAKLRENYLRAAEANAEDLQNTYDGMIISVQ